MNRNIFVIHGHDSDSLSGLEELLMNLGCKPIILVKEEYSTHTIIEAFEKAAAKCSFAVALLTPDDKQAANLPTKARYRARQNVILEIGWFMAKLGRRGVLLLHRGRVELPSDLLGILYIPFKRSVFEKKGRIRTALQNSGVISRR